MDETPFADKPRSSCGYGLRFESIERNIHGITLEKNVQGALEEVRDNEVLLLIPIYMTYPGETGLTSHTRRTLEAHSPTSGVYLPNGTVWC